MTDARRLPAAQGLALAVLAAGLIGACAIAWLAFAAVATRRDSIREAREMVSQLEARERAGASGASSGDAAAANPFLAGDSVNVAGANLQERVVAAIRRAGGNVSSSQVDLTDIKSAPRRVALAASLVLAQPALQGLLYDLEAGSPYLFVDQIVIQSGQDGVGDANATVGTGAMLRVSLSVSGYWRGGTP